jgi:hypothetical protein
LGTSPPPPKEGSELRIEGLGHICVRAGEGDGADRWARAVSDSARPDEQAQGASDREGEGAHVHSAMAWASIWAWCAREGDREPLGFPTRREGRRAGRQLAERTQERGRKPS